MQTDIQKFLSFIEHFYKLKDIQRTGWKVKLKLNEPETVASHTFLMMVLTLFLSETFEFSSRKTLKILKMIVIHDLAESIIGDLTPDSIDRLKKNELENNAMNNILLNMTNKKLRNKYIKIWFEYLENKSNDSLFVHLIDKLEMAIQANYYFNSQFKIDKNDIEIFYKSAIDYYNDIINEDNLLKNDNSIKHIKKVLDFITK